jgi:hypothetical protein
VLLEQRVQVFEFRAQRLDARFAVVVVVVVV